MSNWREMIGKALRDPIKAMRIVGRLGKEAVSRAAASILISLVKRLPPLEAARLKDEVQLVVELDYGRSRLLLHADTEMDPIRARACAKEPETVAWIEDEMHPDDCVWDIGANVGAYSLIAGALGRDGALVYAFEPSFSTFAQLCRNVVLNNMAHRVQPYLVALGSTTEFAVLNYTSIQAGTALHALGTAVDQHGHGFHPVYSQRVPSFSVDDLCASFGFRPPTLIKLDVDGTELSILEGASRVLCSGAVRSLLIEVADTNSRPAQVEEYMNRCGFRLSKRHDHGGQVANYVFVRAGSSAPRKRSL